MASTRAVLLETNEEICVFAEGKGLPLISMRHEYVMHQNIDGCFTHFVPKNVDVDGVDEFKLCKRTFYSIDGALLLSSIYDYHYKNTFDV